MLKVNTVLDGKYEILKKIGEGGMSVVYLARNNRLNMQLAVKEIKNDGSKSTRVLLKGLEREANILKGVDHPVIPRIIDIVKYNDTVCVIMDYIEGENLLDHIKKYGPIPQEQVVEWSLELADALKYLHSLNPPIIYRDMKPANIMLKPGGGVKLIDFGTAKEYTIENNADTTALGTRGYAAPEQFGDEKGRGKYKTDARTDIYNLGATMYHMVTGRSPQDPPYEILPIRQVNPALSSGLEKIILKCTRPNPNDRYQNCSELIYALQHYTEQDDEYLQANRRKVRIFAGLLLLALVSGGISLTGNLKERQRLQETYENYIELGNDARAETNYEDAKNEYIRAIKLKPAESGAYINYMNSCIAEKNSVKNTDDTKAEDSGADAEEQLKSSLNVVAGRISKGDITAKNNPEVVNMLGQIYFTELSDYQTAYQYFNSLNQEKYSNKELDEAGLTRSQVQSYAGISQILSNPSISKNDISQLLVQTTDFAKSTMGEENVDEKFEKYRAIGKIYTRYKDSDTVVTDQTGKEVSVAEMADQVLNQALEDLNDYQEQDSTGKENLYTLEFSNDLATIDEQLGDQEKNADYYDAAIQSCESVKTLARQILSEGGIAVGDAVNEKEDSAAYGYIQNYVDMVCREAAIYEKIAQVEGSDEEKEREKAVKIFKQAESDVEMGHSSNAIPIYVAHLNFLYEWFEEKSADPAEWSEDEKNEILTVYDSGSQIPGITENHNWALRRSTMESLKDGSLDTQNELEKMQDARNTDTASNTDTTGEGE